MDNKPFWYSYDRVLSYHALMNYIIGERGCGKSYNLKAYLLNRFKKKHRQFIYLRRYDTELKKSLKDDEFFKDVASDPLFKEDTFYVRGEKFYMNDEICGYAIALSKASIYKSVPFPNVDIIMFDEFLIDNATYHYIQNEPEKLLDFIETVGRLRNIQIFMLGNNISMINPYFDYFNISLPYNTDIKTFKEGLILINYIKNEAYRKVKKESNFGKLIEGTKYAEYAIDNKALKDNNNFIKKKSPKAKFFFNLILNNHTYGVWIDYNSNNMYISKHYNPDNPTCITFNYNDHSEHTIMLKSKSVFFQNLVKHYLNAWLYFDTLQIKSDVTSLIHRTHR